MERRLQLILALSQVLAKEAGLPFFQRLTQELVSALNADYALVGSFSSGASAAIHTLAVYGEGRILPNFRYELAGTPCEITFRQEFCHLTEGVQSRFPADPLLRDKNVDAYMGIRLLDSSRRELGILVVLRRSPFEDPEFAEHLVRLVAVRVATELERQRAEQSMRESQSRYRALFDAAGDAVFLMRGDVFIDCNPRTLSIFGCARDQILGQSPQRFSPLRQPDGRDSHTKALEKIAAALSGEPQSFYWRHLQWDGTAFEAEVTLTRVELDGEYHLLAIVRDVTQRIRDQRALLDSKAALEKRNASLKLINRLAQQLHATQDLKAIGEQTLHALSGLEEAPTGAFYLVDPEKRELEILSFFGCDEDTAQAGARLPLEGSLSGAAIREGDILVCPDITADDRLEPRMQRPLMDTGIKSALLMPLFFMGVPLGTINLVFRENRHFPREELSTLRAIAGSVAVAVKNAQNFAQTEYRALHDSLTGLPNRSWLHEHLPERLASAGGKAALMLLDLDRFKEVNETLGHHVGDELLKLIGPRIREGLSARSDVVRLGGDEFVCAAYGVGGVRKAEEAAGRILDRLGTPFELDGMHLEIGASIGIALYPAHGTDSHALLRCADVAMYRAKEAGTGYRLFDESFDRNAPERVAILTDLRGALRSGQLFLEYQPQIALNRDCTVACEALIRWRHPQLGTLYPGRFVRLAEMSNVIVPLSSWVMDQALAQLRAWEDEAQGVRVAINLSPRNLLNRECPGTIARLIQEHRVSPELIEIEITENALISDPGRARETLMRIARLGVNLAIDDFGTGYSSLSYLKQLPIHVLKIDKSFVTGMLEDVQDEEIVRSTIDLAHNLGLRVVAEGVENEQILRVLKEMGCDLAQGYHISRPVGAAPALEVLRRIMLPEALAPRLG